MKYLQTMTSLQHLIVLRALVETSESLCRSLSRRSVPLPAPLAFQVLKYSGWGYFDRLNSAAEPASKQGINP
jgi:hypothetical protein